MAVTLGKWEARIKVATAWADAGNFTLTEAAGGGAQDISVAAASYFWSAGLGAGVSFAAALKAALEAASSNAQTYTVTLAASEASRAQTVTISSSAAFTLDFGSGDGVIVKDLCGGFSDPTGSASSHTSDGPAQAVWLPDQPAWSPTTLAHTGRRRRLMAMSTAPDGTHYRFVGAKRQVKRLVYRGVAKTLVILEEVAAADVNATLEKFWDDSIGGDLSWSAGATLAWYQDAAAATYQQFNPRFPEADYRRVAENYDQLWIVEFLVQKAPS